MVPASGTLSAPGNSARLLILEQEARDLLLCPLTRLLQEGLQPTVLISPSLRTNPRTTRKLTSVKAAVVSAQSFKNSLEFPGFFFS